MSRRSAVGHVDPHARFTAWLLKGATGDLPRDVLVHAAYCDDCRRQVAALDALAMVDLQSAPMPPPRPQAAPAARRGPVLVARTLAAGGLIVAVTGGVLAATGTLPTGLGGPSETPVQQVLGGTGRPSPTLAPSPTPTSVATERTS
jgi:hypothetical protein